MNISPQNRSMDYSHIRSPKSRLGTRTERIYKTKTNPFRTTERQRANSIQRRRSRRVPRLSTTYEKYVLGMRPFLKNAKRSGPRRLNYKEKRLAKTQRKLRHMNAYRGRGTRKRCKRR
jgi:hypothetical protein